MVMERIKQLLRPLKRWIGPRSENYYVQSYSKINPDVHFLQIGANDGMTDDSLFKAVIEKKWTGIVVEPVSYLFKLLESNYSANSRIYCVQKAVSDRFENRKFYRLRKNSDGLPHWYEQIGSFDKKHILKHLKFIPDIEKYILEEVVECVPPESLLEQFSFEKLDVLLIDTEGYDYQILKVFPFSKFLPKLLIFEYEHLSNEERILSKQLLFENNYIFTTYGFNCIAFQKFQVPFAWYVQSLLWGRFKKSKVF